MKNKKTGIAAGFIILFAGAFVLLFPYIRGEKCEKDIEKAYENFHIDSLKAEEKEDEPFSELYNYLKSENDLLFSEGQKNLTDEKSYSEKAFELSDFGLESGVIAYIKIPVMEVFLPVVLGASRENMNSAAAHMTNTSYPIGGENTNCVIAAHRGYIKPPMFRYIDRMKKGDKVYIENFRETLEYTVTETRIIEPDSVKDLLIAPGRDILTLFTCHPLYVYNLRYIVICDRSS